jgi:multimeric flavodoxin WrbA
MNITTVLGSPRKKGNTSRVLGWVEEELRNEGHLVDRLNVIDYKINGCRGCFTCKKSETELGCPQKDEAEVVLSQLMVSDAVIYATPIYFWSPSGQMKTLIDRHCGLVTGFGNPAWISLMEGKQIGLVVTSEDAPELASDLTVELFKRLAHYLKSSYRGELLISGTSKPDALGEDVKARAEAYAHNFG